MRSPSCLPLPQATAGGSVRAGAGLPHARACPQDMSLGFGLDEDGSAQDRRLRWVDRAPPLHAVGLWSAGPGGGSGRGRLWEWPGSDGVPGVMGPPSFVWRWDPHTCFPGGLAMLKSFCSLDSARAPVLCPLLCVLATLPHHCQLSPPAPPPPRPAWVTTCIPFLCL